MLLVVDQNHLVSGKCYTLVFNKELTRILDNFFNMDHV